MKKEKNYDISVCIPIYNAEKYLEECLESIVNQTYKNIQIVCVNDGSTDKSLQILEKYKKKYKNIKVINQKNQGVIAARIECLKNADGNYIGWVDADDFLELNMYEKMYNQVIKNNADIAICDYNFYPNNSINKKKWFKNYKGIVNWEFIAFNTIQWNKIIKKDILLKNDICNLLEIMGEGCYGIIMIKSQNIVTLNETLYNYRVGHTSLSNNFNNIEWYKNNVEKNYKKYKYICNNNFGEYWENYFKFIYYYYVIALIIISAYNKNYKEFTKNKKIIQKEKKFWKNNKKYLEHYFGSKKILFLKYIGTKSYTLTKIVTNLLYSK